MRFLSRKNDNMGKMKKASIIIALAYVLGIILPFAPAKAEKVQFWAKGVSEDAGWYNTFQFTNGCWAAVSSNMIAGSHKGNVYLHWEMLGPRGGQSGI